MRGKRMIIHRIQAAGLPGSQAAGSYVLRSRIHVQHTVMVFSKSTVTLTPRVHGFAHPCKLGDVFTHLSRRTSVAVTGPHDLIRQGCHMPPSQLKEELTRGVRIENLDSRSSDGAQGTPGKRYANIRKSAASVAICGIVSQEPMASDASVQSSCSRTLAAMQ
jgi:hypothetical protein